MRKKRRLLAIVLCMMVVMTQFSFVAFADDSGENGIGKAGGDKEIVSDDSISGGDGLKEGSNDDNLLPGRETSEGKTPDDTS